MPTLPIYLAVSRPTMSQRAHFGLFIPDEADAHKDQETLVEAARGTILHVVGAPMAGFALQFKRNFNSADAADLRKLISLGSVESALVWTPTYAHLVEEPTARGELDRLAMRIDPPRISENFLAPVDDVKNRRCQEWTMDFLRLLVEKGVLEAEAVETAQKERDPPDFGIGLRSVAGKVDIKRTSNQD